MATTQATTQVTTQATTISSSISYQPFGPMRAMIYGNNLVQSKTYDLDYRLTQLMTVNGNTQQDLAYTLDAANNITAINNALDTTRTQSLGYDALNRLTDATSHYGDIDYVYDALGNRLSKTIQTHTKTYTYASNTHHLEQTQGVNTSTYSYDANGNTTSNTTNTFSYGDNNRLKTSGIGGSTLATYTYNGRGGRVKKDSNDIIYYHYDLAGQLIAETDTTGATQVEYIYLDGQPLALITNGSINYYHNDHLGTPQQMTDQSQNISWQADYNPFGKATMTRETITNNLRFPGQYFDSEIGLHYNQQRYVDPSLGRFITSDRIGLTGGANTYGYALQNPINYYDPNGETATTAQGVVIGGAVAGPPGAVVGGVIGTAIGIWLGYELFWDNDDSSSDDAEDCPPGEDDEPDCSMASSFQLVRAGITHPHEFKRDYVGGRVSRYDICACKDGSIKIAGRGQCGKSGPKIDTWASWK